MANFSKAVLVRVGRMLNSGGAEDPAPLAKLAAAGAFGRKAVYNWTVAESDAQHRAMPPLAKRMVATLAYFSAVGLLNDKRLDEIAALEQALEDEAAANAILRRMKRVLGTGKPPKTPAKAKVDEAEDEYELTDEGAEQPRAS